VFTRAIIEKNRILSGFYIFCEVSMKERDYQASLIKRLNKRYKDCLIMKNDSGYIQGIPDLTVLYNGLWAMLEVKANSEAHTQPNQDYYVDRLDTMSFAAYIHPDNESEVIRLLDQHFGR
jgi:ATP-dependent RNA circularization protein (DNA/RNA ligase family)